MYFSILNGSVTAALSFKNLIDKYFSNILIYKMTSEWPPIFILSWLKIVSYFVNFIFLGNQLNKFFKNGLRKEKEISRLVVSQSPVDEVVLNIVTTIEIILFSLLRDVILRENFFIVV